MMSDLRKRFEKETGKKVEITAHFDCGDSECDYELPVDIWNNEYIMWLENLANGANASDSGLHLQRVSGSALTDQQERAVWNTIRFICAEQAKDPKKMFRRDDVMNWINDNYTD